MRKKNDELADRIEEFMCRHYLEYRRPSSIRETAKQLGISCATVSRYQRWMAERGILVVDGTGKYISKRTTQMLDGITWTPICGKLTHNATAAVLEKTGMKVPFSGKMVGGGDLFLLEAGDDSMLAHGIQSGDLILVRRQTTAEPGRLILALRNDGSVTITRLTPDKESVADLEIQGIPCRIIRTLQPSEQNEDTE